MKKLLLIAFLLLFGRAAAQDSLFDDEWHQGLESELELICYHKNLSDTICIRVYRGASSEHTVSVYDKLGAAVYSCEFERAGDINLTGLCKGIYFLVVSNDKKMLTQKIFIHN